LSSASFSSKRHLSLTNHKPASDHVGHWLDCVCVILFLDPSGAKSQRQRTRESDRHSCHDLTSTATEGRSAHINALEFRTLARRRFSIIFASVTTSTRPSTSCTTPSRAQTAERQRKSEGAVLPTEAEEQIVMWIISIRKDGAPVSLLMLRLKAKEVASDCGFEGEMFAASDTWIKL
jgi:hypothetical protein